MTTRKLRFVDLLMQWRQSARAAPIPIAVSIVLLTAIGCALDTQTSDLTTINAGNFAISLVALLMQLWVMQALLGPDARRRGGGSRVIGLFLMGIVTTIGVLLGLLLLVLPGLYLAARWRVAVPILLAEDVSIGEALNESWRRTATAWRPLTLATALIALPQVVSAVILWFSDPVSTPIQALSSNLLLYVATVAGWVLDYAAYRLLVRPSDALVETFA